MSEWKRYKLSELYEMSSGISSTKEQAGHGSPFLSFSVVFNNYFLPDSLIDLMDTTDGEKQKYSINEGDIFLTRTSETVDELAMSSVALKDYPEASFSGFLKRLRPVDKTIVYPKFMAFYLRSPLFRRTIINNTVMTLRASFNEAMFSYLEIMLPDFETQKKVGDFLYSLEKKKQINNQINQELEAMAKTLYDYWFVQFDFPDQNDKPYKSSGGKMVYSPELKREIPEGWGVAKVEDIAQTGSGGTPKSTNVSYYSNGEIPWINSGELEQTVITSTSNFITEEGLNNSSAKLFPSGTILVAMYGATAGKVSFLTFEASTNQAICAIMLTDIRMRYYLKNVIEDLYQYLVKLSTGSARDNLSQDMIKNIKVVIPSNDILDRFYDFSNNIIKEITKKQQENEQLTQLRDWLLPMLMNGQVKVE